MKAFKIAGALALASVTLLCSCTATPQLTISSNWYEDSSVSTIAGSETLTYRVTHENQPEDSYYGVRYSGGTYVTQLSGATATLSDGTNESVYLYKTSLTISGEYYYNHPDDAENAKTRAFTDNTETEVKFRRTEYDLAPVSSKSTSTISVPSMEGEALYLTYLVEQEITYDVALNSAQVKKTTTLLDENGEPTVGDEESPNPVVLEQTLSLYGSVFLDNDMLLFAMRGFNFGQSALSFTTIDPQNVSVESTSVSSATTEEYTLNGVTFGGQLKDGVKLSANAVSVQYDKTFSGSGLKLWYATKSESGKNVYRNVMLRAEKPIFYSMGTLVYTLQTAEFS